MTGGAPLGAVNHRFFFLILYEMMFKSVEGLHGNNSDIKFFTLFNASNGRTSVSSLMGLSPMYTQIDCLFET